MEVAKKQISQRILVVEDEPILRHLLAKFLRGAGHDVVEAADGQAAWDLIKAGAYDAVLSDISMPELNGLELLAKLREHQIDTPFVFLSAYQSDEHRQEAERLGARGLLAKPFRREEVLEALDDALAAAATQGAATALATLPPLAFALREADGGKLCLQVEGNTLALSPSDEAKIRNAMAGGQGSSLRLILELTLSEAGPRLFEMVGKASASQQVEGFLLDQTERENSLRELQREQAVLRDVLSTIPHSVFWKDRNSVYLGGNDRFLQSAGKKSVRELVGCTDFDLPWQREEAEAYRRDDAALMASGNSRLNIEETQMQPDGRILSLVTSKVPLRDAQNRITGILGIYMDISELRNTQRELLEKEARLHGVAKMAALGEMASGIAHEINNPLAIIQALAFDLSEYGDQNPARMRTSLQAIEKTAERIAKIVSGLRTFSRNESGADFKPACLEEILTETMEFCRDRFQASKIRLDLPDPARRTIISCRRTEISQVLLNLLNNAVDALSGHSAPWVKVEIFPMEKHVEVRITDAGPGIPEAIREKILQPFFTTKEVGKGTGLGLSISHGILKAHGGSLRYNEESPNTQFIVSFPA